MSVSTATPLPSPRSHALARAEVRAADAVGSLMELWGFRRQLGRIWTVLFLSERPLAAPEMCERLQISTGLLSMSLAELRRWEVVRGVSVRGDRKEHYAAETNVWKMVRRVLADVDPRVKAAARLRVQRLAQLVALSRTALGILRVLVESARVDLAPLKSLSEALSGRPRS